VFTSEGHRVAANDIFIILLDNFECAQCQFSISPLLAKLVFSAVFIEAKVFFASKFHLCEQTMKILLLAHSYLL